MLFSHLVKVKLLRHELNIYAKEFQVVLCVLVKDVSPWFLIKSNIGYKRTDLRVSFPTAVFKNLT